MSKATPASVTHTNSSTLVQPIYIIGEKVFFTFNGRVLPCKVVGTTQSKGVSDSSGVAYTVQGDISGLAYPTNAPRGPFKNVPVSLLTDRP